MVEGWFYWPLNPLLIRCNLLRLPLLSLLASSISLFAVACSSKRENMGCVVDRVTLLAREPFSYSLPSPSFLLGLFASFVSPLLGLFASFVSPPASPFGLEKAVA